MKKYLAIHKVKGKNKLYLNSHSLFSSPSQAKKTYEKYNKKEKYYTLVGVFPVNIKSLEVIK